MRVVGIKRINTEKFFTFKFINYYVEQKISQKPAKYENKVKNFTKKYSLKVRKKETRSK